MSGAEHLDIASAHLKEINDSVGCANVHVEPSRENDQSVPNAYSGLPGKQETDCYTNSALSKDNEEGGSIANSDKGKCGEDSLNLIQTAGGELGMPDNEVRGCEPDEMGNRNAVSVAPACKNGEIHGEISNLVKSNHNCDGNGVSSKLSDVNVDKTDAVVIAPAAESSTPVESTVGFGNVSLCNQPGEEKAGTQIQSDLTESINTVECPPGSTSPERLANSSKHGKTPDAIGKGNPENDLQSAQKGENGSDAAPDNVKVEQTAEYDIHVTKLSPKDGGQRSLVGQMENSHHGVSESSCGIEESKAPASDIKDCPNEQAGSISGKTRKPYVVVFGCPADGTSGKPWRARRSGKFSAVSTKKTYPQRSSRGRTRALSPNSQGNPEVPEPSANLENKPSSTGKRRGRKKKTEMEGKSHDKFSRTRTHLRYLLHRIRYEQNFLDAYSSEGWRGQSLEKLRPEKELQRAKADINRSKLKIRDLFRQLDSMSAEGRFPESLFDSEGLIDSEDIFCAKCGSKELSADNDIILCDGTCERGFHQFCLEPPLRTEEIPPGDQGWLCPACDCKADCIDVLNDSQGTKLSIEDKWEKVFPEAATSLAGNAQDDIMGLPSDDSEDNDYNPDGADDDVMAEGSGSSSDGSGSSGSDSSDFSSASEDLGAIGGADQYVGLPSDDSEDDDYDPDATNINDNVEQESSSSDFTSASEDLDAAARNDGSSGDDETTVPLSPPDQDTADSPPMSGRRHVERLDYKKLYDDTYGDAPSDSSDDEEWADIDSTCEKKGSTGKGVLDSSTGNALATDGSAAAPRRRGRKKKVDVQAANGSPAQPVKSSQKASSSADGTKRPRNRLGEAVTRRLYESFKENQYPDRTTKENLAKELGLTPLRVDKWFGNARWSFNHHPERLQSSMEAATSLNTPSIAACNGVESASGDANTAVPVSKETESSKLDGKASGKRKQTPSTSRKRKNTTEDGQPAPQNLNSETPEGGAQTDSLQPPEVETNTSQAPVAQGASGRKRRKSKA